MAGIVTNDTDSYDIEPKFVVQSQGGVTLVGGGEWKEDDLHLAQAHAPCLVAADGGANRLVALDKLPERVIGDLDSLDQGLHARLADRLVHIAEQESTDLDKALRNISAPFVLGLGFAGGRLDHTLAALRSLVRHSHCRVILLAGADIVFLAPPQLVLSTRPGARVSLFPMAPVTGRSQGLHWPIDGIDFAPQGVIGTSNRADAAEIRLEFDAPAMLVLLERVPLDAALATVLEALAVAPGW